MPSTSSPALDSGQAALASAAMAGHLMAVGGRKSFNRNLLCELLVQLSCITATMRGRTLARVLYGSEGARDVATAVRLAGLDVVAARAGALHDGRRVGGSRFDPDGVVVFATGALARWMSLNRHNGNHSLIALAIVSQLLLHGQSAPYVGTR